MLFRKSFKVFGVGVKKRLSKDFVTGSFNLPGDT